MNQYLLTLGGEEGEGKKVKRKERRSLKTREEGVASRELVAGRGWRLRAP